MAGDAGTLSKLYSQNPPVTAVAGKITLANPEDEWRYWVGLKQAGITEFDPKLLEITRTSDKATLRLRVKSVQGGEKMVAAALQTWTKQGPTWRIVAARRSDFVRDAVRTLPQPVKPNTDLYSDPAEAQAELTSALAKARQSNRRVVVVFGGNWCYDCHVLDTTFHSKEFAPLLDANYVVVHINVGDEGKDNNDLAARLGVAVDKGVPSLGVLDPDGAVVYAQKNGEFESTVKIGQEDVRAFLEKWKPVRAR